MYLWIYFHRVEDGRFSQWTENLTHKYGLEIDGLRNAVVELNPEPVRANHFKLRDAINCVFHDSILAALWVSLPLLAATLRNRLPTPPDVVLPKVQVTLIEFEAAKRRGLTIQDFSLLERATILEPADLLVREAGGCKPVGRLDREELA